jgi:hypothetical protein
MKKFLPVAFIVTSGVLISAACRQTSRQAPAPAAAEVKGESRKARSIAEVYPSRAYVGEPFQKQPNGFSAISIIGKGLTPKDVIFWDDQPLRTAFGNSTFITAEVPADLLSKPKHVEISVRDPSDPASERLRVGFELLSRANAPG